MRRFLEDERGMAVQWIVLVIVAAIMVGVFFKRIKPGTNNFSRELGESFNRIVK